MKSADRPARDAAKPARKGRKTAAANVTAEPPRRGLATLAAALPRIAEPLARRRGFTTASIVTRWADVVGPQLASETLPEKIGYAAGQHDGGTLRLRVAPGLAPELQHMTPQLIDRINQHFGYRAVARITLVQGPVPANRAAVVAAPADDAPVAAPEVTGIADDGLRAALARLGSAVRRAEAIPRKSDRTKQDI